MQLFKQMFISEKGNAALYIAVCLPMVFAFTVLVIDVSRFQSLKESGQTKVDEIAVNAARLLPNTTSALAYVIDTVSLDDDLSLAVTPDVTNDRVSITLTGSVSSLFDFFFEIGGNQGQVFSFEESSTAVVVPQDVIILMADDRTLRPHAREAWGSELSWPESKYFSFVKAPEITQPLNNDNTLYWNNWWESFSDTLYQRWATQSCYNPVFSALKSSVISFIDRAQSTSTNQIGLFFTPGDDSLLGFSKAQSLSVSPSIAQWSAYWEPRSYISDEACVLFADESESDDLRYSIFSLPGFIDSDSNTNLCDSFIENRTWGAPFYPFGNLSSCYLSDSLSLRESVYYHAVRANEHTAGAGNVIETLKQAVSDFTEIDSVQMQLLRGNLYTSSTRRVVAFLDAFPDITGDSLSEILSASSSKGTQIELDIILFSHRGMSSNEISELENIANRLEGDVLSNIRIFYANGVDDLSERVMPEVLRRSFEVVLRS